MADGFWVFGYGSLVWHPGFAFDDKRVAVLHGWRRAFCMASIMYRGTPEAPGLVLALDRDAGGHCLGVAYHVRAGRGGGDARLFAGARAGLLCLRRDACDGSTPAARRWRRWPMSPTPRIRSIAAG